ncbi:MAG TPA: adenosylcobinamide-GDP ribazoletransferase [Egibacteraceae bacterium]|nr:adenosylcobinamide-GDP ribazoletransferase [Egibacteraceae bacterium]
MVSKPGLPGLAGVAVGFLTRLPVRHPGQLPDDALRRAGGAFPAVGLLVGAVGVGVRALAEPLWGPVAATVVAVGATIVVTGALHEDGLADTADGLWGGGDPAARVAILRDSRLGTYGVLVLVLTVGLRVALLAPLGLAAFARALLCAHVLGQGASLLHAHALPPAAASGSGARMAGRLPRGGAAFAGATVLGTVAAATGLWAVAPLAAALTAALGTGVLFRARFGGVTGDTLGAVNQVAHLAALAAVTALADAGLL